MAADESFRKQRPRNKVRKRGDTDSAEILMAP